MISAARPQAGSPRSSKTAKEPEKYRLEPHFTKPKTDFFFQISVQFRRRAATRRGGMFDISESVAPTRVEPVLQG